MKRTLMAAICLVAGAAAAFGQDEPDKRLENLKREFDRTMKGLAEKFDQERGRLEKEFKAARERLLEKKGDPQEKKEPRGVEDLLREVLKRVESLEKRLDGEMPRLRELHKVIPRSFDFEKLPGVMPEEFRKWMEQMPKFKGGEDFKFEFRKGEPKADPKADPKKDEEKPKAKPKKKDDEDKQQD
jgi:hypothetical protein